MNNSEIIVQSQTDDQKLEIALNFLSALRIGEWNLLRSIITEDCEWTLPGTSMISGDVIGADAIIERARIIVGFEVTLQLNHILYGQYDVVLSIHTQASRDGFQLNEFLAMVCLLKEAKIAAINTHLSNVLGVNAFFTEENLHSNVPL